MNKGTPDPVQQAMEHAGPPEGGCSLTLRMKAAIDKLPEDQKKIPTGFPSIDRIFPNGIPCGDIFVIAARSRPYSMIERMADTMFMFGQEVDSIHSKSTMTLDIVKKRLMHNDPELSEGAAYQQAAQYVLDTQFPNRLDTESVPDIRKK